jgi:glycerophosphoryl diester phosphodiesterase
MKGMLKKLIKSKVVWIILGMISFMWLNNSSLFVDRSDKHAFLLAHGALGQTYDLEGVKWNTNTAARIHKPEHFYIENTLPSMKAAFDFGADIVEFDIRLTKDMKLAVFHDDTLEYRTNGIGHVSDYTMDELKKLDVGYGYTADNGKTYPLRGKGIGLMVSIEEVFNTFPDKKFLIHIKDGGDKIGPVLVNVLLTLERSTIEKISVYGNDVALNLLRENFPDMKILSKSKMIKAGLMYVLIGWTGFIPESIKNLELHIPIEYAPFLWGWPDKFLQRMDRVNTQVILVQYVNGWSNGFDSEIDFNKVPDQYTGGIWTNRIDIIGPFVKE